MSLNIEPKNVFHWFYELNQIPRCSGNEKAVSDFLTAFAKERHLDVTQDEAYNVIIRKPASAGYENATPVILQGHMDMVCVKNDDVDHNFDTDPIEMIVEGDFIRANGTSLGGDNGIAVAYAMAILDGDYEHPALEVLITTNEETGMDGAAALKEGMLQGKRLINMDSEEEGVFLVSCAGGATIEIRFAKETESVTGSALTVAVSGLKGGHSGQEIGKGRGNANKILFRLIHAVQQAMDVQLATVKGGMKHNAIPDAATATIVVDDTEKAESLIQTMAELITLEYTVEEPGLTITCESSAADTALTKAATENIVDFFIMAPNGVISMSKDIEGLVQTSLNNAVVTDEDNMIVLETSIRSSSESELDSVIETLATAAKRVGATTELTNRYPAWQFEQDSPLRDISLSTYKALFGKEARYDAIHAGLECGLLKKVLPDCDMISYGPDMFDIHSPKEHLSISSSQRMWDFTVALLKNLK
ncbi:aminoacyl-histidine dipeptidase [Peptoniphilus equinus]|uniref:Aminoacyl-histidine dipeptidase n=1 Tax=Peptoniphilus equinus TaxID=3016343 RepID=A0ABY7QTQ8_9FIRM|nr:aminoacyl-histidine dipeptidase [Peptoniphilus equinus]WBW50178.1 aminoacyl-histidine dipeptidase [Peptoniphilus equinus]